MLKRLIEVSLPLKEVSEQSAREKSIRHGHISTLHIWWARRPLAACRAAVFASLIPDPDDAECPESFRKLVSELLSRSEFKPKNGDGSTVDDTQRNRCLEFIKHLVKWENSNAPEYIVPARKLIAAAHRFLHPDAEGDVPKVLDPFAGGGAIPLEALRLGCETYAVDLNPVAHLIELCTLVYPQKYGQPDSRAVPDYIKRLTAHNTAKKRTKTGKGLFEDGETAEVKLVDDVIPDVEITENDYRKNPLAADLKYWGHWALEVARKQIGHLYAGKRTSAVPVAFLWARTIKCPNPQCGIEVPMLQTSMVFSSGENATILGLKSIANRLVITHQVVSRPSDDETAGTLGRNSALCPHCQATIQKSALEKIGKTCGFGQVLTAVIEEDGSGKKCRRPEPEDYEAYHRASQLLTSLRKEGKAESQCVIDAELPYLRSIFNVHVYGLDNWSKLFNDRQLATLACFARCVKSAVHSHAGQEDQEYYRAVASYLLLALGRQADYGSSLCLWSPDGGFLAHTFGRQALPMVWDYAEGNPFGSMTGNWSGGLDWIHRVILHLSATLMSPGNVVRGDATKTALSDEFIDCVLTDPPYYDAIPYSNLSDFFYVWFRPVAKEWLPTVFGTPLSPKGPEIVQLAERNPAYKHKTKEFFEDRMQKAFAEGRRTLTKDGLYTVVYAHKTTAAWETLVSALIKEGLAVTASWPLHTERPGRLRAHSSAALASSVFLVCRRRDATVGSGLWDDVRQELKTTAQERLDFFWNQGIRGADFFISAIGPALSVFGKYERVTKLSGEEVTVGQFLDEVRSLVTGYALTKILQDYAHWNNRPRKPLLRRLEVVLRRCQSTRR